MISPMRTTFSNAGDDWDSGANILQSLNKAQVSLLPKVTKHSKQINRAKIFNPTKGKDLMMYYLLKSDWSILGELQLPRRRGALPRPQRLLGLLPGGELVLSFFISYIHHSPLFLSVLPFIITLFVITIQILSARTGCQRATPASLTSSEIFQLIPQFSVIFPSVCKRLLYKIFQYSRTFK